MGPIPSEDGRRHARRNGRSTLAGPTRHDLDRETKHILKTGHEFERRTGTLMERDALVQVDDTTFEAEVIRSPMPVVVDFYANWCAPCRIIQPTLRELAVRLSGRVKFAEVNVDEAEAVTRSFGIHAIPTYLFVESGTERGREVGPIDPVAFRAVLRRYFAKAAGPSGGRPSTP